MTTQTKPKSSVAEVEKNWVYKDRTYVLTGDNAPVSYTIQNKHNP